MMKRTPGVLATLVASALFLSGCAGTGTGSGTDVFSGQPKAEPAATTAATPEPIDGDLDGDGKLSEREKELIAKRSYTLLDGTVVPTPKQGEAIPAEIAADINTRADGMVEGMAAGSNDDELAFMKFVDDESKRLSRKIVIVAPVFDGICGCTVWTSWLTTGPVAEPTSSKEASTAAAEAFAAKTPSRYAVVVFD
ncbi:hypothetical protein [Mycetocola zhujimingii]|uniref:hypothetical protein n=1 Tax=Mycetocola zhujimingii TaxID=2079792 RepID=UPI000D3447E6|nr:hypothetical protein [Mycetocola zhujimingii]AWB86581.1 hypothetical protein C3E77_08090 [Mycetocola zhujimingii]